MKKLMLIGGGIRSGYLPSAIIETEGEFEV